MKSSEKKYTSAEVTELMYSEEEILKTAATPQDKIAGYLAHTVMLIVAAIFKLSGHGKFWRCGVCRASGGCDAIGLRILSLGESRR